MCTVFSNNDNWPSFIGICILPSFSSLYIYQHTTDVPISDVVTLSLLYGCAAALFIQA